MTLLTKIKYPLALNEAGNGVHIRDAPASDLFHCPGCSQLMVAKQGHLRRWHYAHKPPRALVCDPNLVLHRTAQELILSGFRNAVAQGGEYRLGRLCQGGGSRRGRLLPHCTVPLMQNVAQADSIIERERSVVAGTRSDLLVTHSNGDKLVIEVVHTHEMEEATETAYSKSGIPVLKIRPVWLPQDDGPDKVVSEPGYAGLALNAVAVAYDSLNVTPRFCVGCKEGIKREDEEEAALKRKQDHYEEEAALKRKQDQELYQSITSYLEKKVASIPANVIPCAVRWEKDPFGDCLYLYPSIQNQLGNYGDKLLAMGFVQATEKHWLFFIKLIRGVIFADFGGSPTLPVLQYSGALVYSKGLPPGVIDCIEGHTSKLLKAIGIPMLHDLYEQNPPERHLLYPRTREPQPREQERQRRELERQRRELERWEQERQRREVKRHSQQLRAVVNANPEDRKKYLAGLWAADKPVK